MSRRAAIVEEFDDDTDLPLPSRSLPDTGSRGVILEEIVDVDDDGDDDEDSDEAPELLDHSAGGGPAPQPDARDGRVTDITPYKKCANPLITDIYATGPLMHLRLTWT
jgi:signal recognition particle subunit SRP19